MSNADFTPSFNPVDVDGNYGTTGGDITVPTFHELKPFRFWCQKALPLVYDDSLSYYELLCKVVNYLNNMMSDLTTATGSITEFAEQFIINQTFLNNMAQKLGENTESLEDYINARMGDFTEAYEELQSYVNTYFDNLDLQSEVDTKLDVMAQDGTLSMLLNPITEDWLEETTARVTADLANQNQTIATQNSRISVLEGRMDTFASLPSGSTSGNAELLDIRTNFLGETYESAGDSVRASDLLASGYIPLSFSNVYNRRGNDTEGSAEYYNTAYFDVTKYKGGHVVFIYNTLEDYEQAGLDNTLFKGNSAPDNNATEIEPSWASYTIIHTYTGGGQRVVLTCDIPEDFDSTYLMLAYVAPNITPSVIQNEILPAIIIYGNTWSKTPVDTTLSVSGEAADAKATGDAVTELNERLGGITGIENLINTTNIVQGKYILNDGSVTDYSDGSYIDSISVEEGFIYRFLMESHVNVSNSIRIHGYNSSGTWVKQLALKTFTTISTEELNITIPDGISFIKVAFVHTQDSVIYIYKDYSLQNQIYTFTNDINNRLTHIETRTDLSSSFDSGYRTLNVDIGETVNTAISANAAWRTLLVPVRIGDRFIFTGYGGNASRAYGITDASLKLLENAPANTQVSDHTIYIKTDGYAIFNYDTSKPHSLIYIAVTIDKKIEALKTIELTDWKYGYITNNGTVGSIFTGATYGYSSTWRFQFLRVHNGDHFTLTATGGNSAVPYCLLNDANQCLAVGASNTTYKEISIDVTADGYMIINALATSDYKLSMRVNDDYSVRFKPSIIPCEFEPVSSVAYDSSTLYSYTDIISGYDALVTAYPNNITKTSLGYDESETYQIYKYEFTPTIPTLDGYQEGMGAKYTADDFPTFFMDACIHGNEPPCARALLNLMTKIYSSDDTSIYNWMKNHIKFVIIPVANPYGYVNNIRGNVNGVDLNRNFTLFWDAGSSDTSSSEYRGTAPLSEAETEYIDSILQTLKDKNAIYFSWHTHGVWTSYEEMTCYSYPLTGNTFSALEIANDLIPLITASGHENHELPLNSGFIGIPQVNLTTGTSAYQASKYGIPSASPEVMYKYYDGSYGIDYSTKINCMNLEYMLITVMKGYQYLIERN